MTVTLHVCTTCKAGEPVEDGRPVPGARLHAALLAGEIPEGLRIVGVECLSACNSGAAVALSAPVGGADLALDEIMRRAEALR